MTISPAVLDAMVAAGCTAEQIAAVVKADMAANDDKRADKRAKDAERQRRHRARNAESQSVTRDRCDTLPPSPSPLSSPPTPPPIIPQTPSTIPATKRATRLSPDWALPAAWGRWAVAEGLSEAAVRLEADKFRDYWCSKSGKDATKVDWEATWRNWIRNSGGKTASRGPPSRPSMTPHQQRHHDAKAEIEKFLNRGQRHDPDPPGHHATVDLDPRDFRVERPAGAQPR